MFVDISLMAWISGAIVFAVGGGAGFFTARQIKDKRTLELEQQLEATQGKLTEYQDDVNRHFLKTSLLFNKLTDNYREVYDHLATGAQKLCTDKPHTTALDLPTVKILSTASQNHIDTEKTHRITGNTAPVPTTTNHHDSEHYDSEDLGVETIGAAEATSLSNGDTASTASVKDNTASAATPDERTTAKTAANEIETAADITDDIPTITNEELKKLEANEQTKDDADDVHLGAESTPGVEIELHKTHPAIH